MEQVSMAKKAATLDGLRVDLARRRVTIVQDDRTDEWRIDQVRQASKKYGRAWMIVFDDAAELLARVKLQPVSVRVLWWSMGKLDPKEWRQIDQATLAGMVGADRTAVSRALGELVDKKILQRDGRRGYRTSIWLGWRGTAQAYQKERRNRATELNDARLALEQCAGPAPVFDALAPWRRG
jgi:hypothetical protein